VATRNDLLQRNDCDGVNCKKTECEAPEMRGSLTCELPHKGTAVKVQ
jgi:hypothetical protein